MGTVGLTPYNVHRVLSWDVQIALLLVFDEWPPTRLQNAYIRRQVEEDSLKCIQLYILCRAWQYHPLSPSTHRPRACPPCTSARTCLSESLRARPARPSTECRRESGWRRAEPAEYYLRDHGPPLAPVVASEWCLYHLPTRMQGLKYDAFHFDIYKKMNLRTIIIMFYI